jgi:16S rRNA (cytidine1402-2'-O)-methyltransferase
MPPEIQDSNRITPRTGILYVVATPIGNLEDITLRAIRILKQVDLIACEDTRRAARLLHHYGISTPRESYHEHNESQRTPHLLDLLRDGKSVALIADAGTPLVSDPGYRLVSACRDVGIPVVPIPGPSATAAALSASGLPTDSFLFAGYLPSRRWARRNRLLELSRLPCTLIFYEAPHRLLAALDDMLLILGPRRACLAREITKVHEEWLRGTLREILESMKSRARVLGEITILVDRGAEEASRDSTPDSIEKHLEKIMAATGGSQKEALKDVARQRGITRREAYRLLLEEKAGHPASPD